MKTLSTLILCLGVFFLSLAQNPIESEWEKSLNAGNYDSIIKAYPENEETTAYTDYVVGMAYYMKSDDSNTVIQMNRSIAKDSSFARAHFIKGMGHFFLQQLDSAQSSIENAIRIEPENGEYQSGLGEVYLQLEQKELALQSFLKAKEKAPEMERPFLVIPQIQLDLGDGKAAITSYEEARKKIGVGHEMYAQITFNIGLIEYLENNPESAEVAFTELIRIRPKDYQARAKLIQSLYAQDKIDLAATHRDLLYEAHKKDELPEDMAEMFCFDQFIWKEQRIMVFERFESPKGKLYYKHVFYLLDENGKAQLTIQTEHSPFLPSGEELEYILGMDKDGAHYTYPIGIKASMPYNSLKEIVIQVLEEKVSPSASSRRSN